MTEIKKLMIAATQKDVSGFADEFNKLMGQRLLEAIEERKAQMAGYVFAQEDTTPPEDEDDEEEIEDLDEVDDDDDFEDLDEVDEALIAELDALSDEEFANVAEGLIHDGYLDPAWLEADEPDLAEMCAAVKKASKKKTA